MEQKVNGKELNRKSSKKITKRIYFIISASIVLLVIIVAVVLFIQNGKGREENTNLDIVKEQKQKEALLKIEEYENQKNDTDIKGNNFVQMQENKSVINQSDFLKENKQLNHIAFSDIEVIYQDNQTQITMKLTNATNEDIDLDFIQLKIMDSSNHIFKIIDAYIGVVEKNTDKKIVVTTQVDIANLKDIIFEK